MPAEMAPRDRFWSDRSSAGLSGDELLRMRERERQEERTLLARVCDGDTRAFAMLVERHIDRLTRFAFYMLGSADAAEDLTQAVFVQLWEVRHTLDIERPLRPYLLRAIQNRALNERRSQAVREKYQADVRANAAAGTMRSSVPSPEDSILTGAMVQDALRGLPERRQYALRLWLEGGFSDAEVAETLGISVQAADRLMRRALADLREILIVSK